MSVDDGLLTAADRALSLRVLRRETHSSRAGAAIVVAIVLALIGIAAGAGSVWLLVDPGTREAVAAYLSALTAEGLVTPVVIVAAVVAALLGLWLVLLALLPGRRPRHGRFDGRIAVVAEDGVVADLIADRVAKTLGVDRSRIRATVGRRTATVVVTPTSGVTVDRGAASGAVETASSGLGIPLVPHIVVAEHGVVA